MPTKKRSTNDAWLGPDLLKQPERVRSNVNKYFTRCRTDMALLCKRSADLDRLIDDISSKVYEQDGFCVLSGVDINEIPEHELIEMFLGFCAMFGKPIPQNAAGDLVVRVEDRGDTLKTGGRYHNSKDGGSMHTDSPQYETPPTLLVMMCVRQANEGGTSRVVDSWAVHNKISDEAPAALRNLEQKYSFGKRGDHQADEPSYVTAPIFSYAEVPIFRYLRDYIIDFNERDAFDYEATERLSALETLDQCLDDDLLNYRLDLNPGDIMFVNNHRIVHGRDPFVNLENTNNGRLLLRLWVA